MAKKKTIVIITIPHAYCNDTDVCDEQSATAGLGIAKYFKQRGVPHKVFKGRVKRLVSDLNRRRSSRKPFHKELDQFIRANIRKNNIIILDVHSGIFKYNEGRSKMVFLIQGFRKSDSKKTRRARIQSREIAEEIAKNISSARVPSLKGVAFATGSRKNFIAEKGLSMGIPAFLLEYNEYRVRPYPQSFHKAVGKGVVDWIKKNYT